MSFYDIGNQLREGKVSLNLKELGYIVFCFGIELNRMGLIVVEELREQIFDYAKLRRI
jgi:hypothetical protein